MPEFGRKIRSNMPPETPAERFYSDLQKPDADKDFVSRFPLDKVPKMIADNDAQDEMEGLETIRSQVKERIEYITGALEIIRQLFEKKTFKHRSTLLEMYNYIEQKALELEGQSLPGETRAVDRNIVFTLRCLLELMQDNYPADLKYLKVVKVLSAKLKDVEVTLNQPEL